MATTGLVRRMHEFGTTIFTEMSALAARTDSINLGQGFPDTDGAGDILEDAVRAIRGGRNQYAPGRGAPELRQAVADHQQDWYGLEYDPAGELLITTGATEAIAATMLALCETGDEVICFEPFYDSYAAAIALAGAVRRPVPLGDPREPGGRHVIDVDAVRSAITPRSRLLLLNSPHNPTGTVFTRAELTEIAAICREHDLIAVTDEVYEHLVFADSAAGTHIPLATLPGMRERTLTISSAGKTFSVTGWKVGWLCGPAVLVEAVLRVKQFLTFTSGAPFQPAVARALKADRATFTGLATDLQERRDLLCGGLRQAGFDVRRSEGTYFVTADASGLGARDGLEFCRELPLRVGVVAVPTQVFYDDPAHSRPVVRFAFCKRRDVLVEAVERLAALRR
jgi:N-succinyldiaminopimelate aminotransferase